MWHEITKRLGLLWIGGSDYWERLLGFLTGWLAIDNITTFYCNGSKTQMILLMHNLLYWYEEYVMCWILRYFLGSKKDAIHERHLFSIDFAEDTEIFQPNSSSDRQVFISWWFVCNHKFILHQICTLYKYVQKYTKWYINYILCTTKIFSLVIRWPAWVAATVTGLMELIINSILKIINWVLKMINWILKIFKRILEIINWIDQCALLFFN